MTQHLTPYGAPPAAPRTRPSAWWFAVGGALVLAAVGAGTALFVWTLSGFLETDATVRADGQPHRISVPTDQDRMLWFDDTVTYPDCRVVDARTEEEIPLRSVSGDFRREVGSADWLGVHLVDPGSGDLEVTCQGAHEGAVVEIGPAPAVDSFVFGLLATVFVPLLLGGAGLVVLIVTGVLFAIGRPRTPTPADPSPTERISR
ncbi:hypothetical protein [Nocardioides sp. cx-173]|uniref:hypothetical protein n=1 Tax=Nocardioides sp. cx-173 TaxID=2898796 RepID=UPI001E51E24C|nr:hypothetical protein [Nocardioides sp. cx-173]MCD4524775.1 hypothetical protein [Nocardioides sp. cx-173]UGB43283.1 hypothetical protein LQ940_07075 [Nocardioides sp. cx-173]